eukprot:gene17416-19159_t
MERPQTRARPVPEKEKSSAQFVDIKYFVRYFFVGALVHTFVMADDFFLPLHTDEFVEEEFVEGHSLNANNGDCDCNEEDLLGLAEEDSGSEKKLITLERKLGNKNTIKGLIKKGKVFEIRRLTRKINMLRKKKGSTNELLKNERKVNRLVEEIEELKSINNDQLSKCIETMILEDKFNSSMQDNDVFINQKELDSGTSEHNAIISKLVNSRFMKPKLLELWKEAYQSDMDISSKVSLKEPLSEHFPSNVQQSNFKQVSKKTEIEGAGRKIAQESTKQRKKLLKVRAIGGKVSHGIKGVQKNKKAISKKEMKIEAKSKTKQIGNRLGQRARRAMWEKLYGKEAEHVKRGLILNRKRKITKDNNQHCIKRKENMGKGLSKQIEKLKPESLHPSWQAKRQQKQLSNIVEFQGTKMTFE